MNINSYLQSNADSSVRDPIRELGVAEGKAECILETLSDYGAIPLGVRERILKQTSFFQLDRWFLLARQVRSVEEFTNRM